MQVGRNYAEFLMTHIKKRSETIRIQARLPVYRSYWLLRKIPIFLHRGGLSSLGRKIANLCV
ncbi:hypothetical protein MCOL2_11397 [Listeria fleischmannii FSL S10-1203]|uniref:Uncharacterized protein n=1 Tax=Listeria fleischmannii FSL S10-1203 TaxID=1265822 RepID=W7DXK4_9LIST|nr:hypothetical protein MCOL2_11397 [Listeria fleischmannii FSL S10-1203]